MKFHVWIFVVDYVKICVVMAGCGAVARAWEVEIERITVTGQLGYWGVGGVCQWLGKMVRTYHSNYTRKHK
jgi:hypothetical protein